MVKYTKDRREVLCRSTKQVIISRLKMSAQVAGVFNIGEISLGLYWGSVVIIVGRFLDG